MVKILRNHQAQFPQFSIIIGQKSILRRYCIKMLKMEFKFKYTVLIATLQTVLTSLCQKKLRKI